MKKRLFIVGATRTDRRKLDSRMNDGERSDSLVYGTLLNIDKLPVTGLMGEIADTVTLLRAFLTGEFYDFLWYFITFCLGRLGYDDKMLTEPDEGEAVKTSQLTKGIWIAAISDLENPFPIETKTVRPLTTPKEEGILNFVSYEKEYEHPRAKIKIIQIWKELPRQWDSSNSSFDVTEYSIERVVRTSKADFIILHPLAKHTREEFLYAKNTVKKITSKNLLVDVLEFLSLLGLGKDGTDELKILWKEIRDESTQQMAQKNKIFALALQYELFARAEDKLKRARTDFQRKVDCDRIASDCGAVVESLLRIIYSPLKTDQQKLTFNDLLERQRKEINSVFGEDMYQDIRYIGDKRNLAAHPNVENLNEEVAYKVLTRTEMCFELFKLKYMTTSFT